MKKNFKLGVIGSGFMAKSIINGIIKTNILTVDDLIVSDISEDALKTIKDKNIHTTLNNSELVKNADFILFAVKPQCFESIAQNLQDLDVNNVISIMAGVKKERIKKFFKNSKVARIMPNTPCSINEGAVAIDYFDYENAEEKKFISDIFKGLGEVIYCNEDLMHAVTGISGSAPAYIYYFIDLIIKEGIKNGLNELDAKKLVVNTVRGTASMVLKNQDKSIDELINAVCSKGGTTIEAMKVLREGEFENVIDKAIEACINRSEELSKL